MSDSQLNLAPLLLVGAGLLALGGMAACHSDTSPSSTTTTTTTTTTSTPTGTAGAGSVTQGMYTQFYGAATVSFSGTTATIKTTDLPDHKSPYWGVGNSLYEAASGGTVINPNKIATQNITLQISLNPQSTTASDTPLGTIGVAVNGVAIYNQYAAGRSPLGDEIISFDAYKGHPDQSNTYHYHVEPLWLTSTSKSRLIGVLLDGFPVYGPKDSDGTTPSNLDDCHGHVGTTPEFPSGLYHYHTTDTTPYISGCYRGTPGSKS